MAGANTGIWRDIYLANADALVDAIDDTVRRLTEVRGALVARDGAAVAAWNDGAREERRRLLEADLAGGAVHELRVSVPNRPGVVAEVALALGRAGVNILDMALYPASDMSSGTIALWVAGDGRADEAQTLVEGLGLTVRAPMRFSPDGPLRGHAWSPPPDKSLSHRAALLAAMTDEPVAITGYLDAADTNSTLAAVQALGALVERRHGSLVVRGRRPAGGGAGRRRSTSATPAR